MNNTTELFERVLQTALVAAKKAGAYIKESHQKRDVVIELKDRTNLVTQYDLGAEKIIIDIIRSEFPDHELLTEETNNNFDDVERLLKPIWIVDPIDGTTNFAHGHYQVSVSIGFAFEGILSVGVVYNPFVEETFTAIRHKGSFKNGAPIACSQAKELTDALVVTGFPYKKDGIDVLIARVKNVLLNCRELRRLGSGALDICWVADGRMDAYYESLSPWDCAAAIVIAREAGVTCGFIDDIPSTFKAPHDFYTDGMLFANPTLFPKMQKLLRV
jgi:myo-inositol-1(or 4)-monophosphatase